MGVIVGVIERDRRIATGSGVKPYEVHRVRFAHRSGRMRGGILSPEPGSQALGHESRQTDVRGRGFDLYEVRGAEEALRTASWAASMNPSMSGSRSASSMKEPVKLACISASMSSTRMASAETSRNSFSVAPLAA